MPTRDLPDDELVRRCLAGEARAWEALVRRYGRLVYGLALRAGLGPEDAADVFQTVFAAAYRNLHVLDRPRSVSFWLAMITRREAWQVRRRLARADAPRSLAPGDAGAREVAAEAPLPEEELERAERALLVHRAVETLDGRCRRLLEMLFFEEPAMSYQEAARSLGMPLGSLGPTRARCLEKLRAALDSLGFSR